MIIDVFQRSTKFVVHLTVEHLLEQQSLWALYVESMLKFSLEQRHDLISTTFQRCSNVRCPLGLAIDILVYITNEFMLINISQKWLCFELGLLIKANIANYETIPTAFMVPLFAMTTF